MKKDTKSVLHLGKRNLLSSRFVRAFARDIKGVVAIEFAMVGIPFFIILFATMEIGLVFVVNRMVDNSVVTASRMIRTGQNSSDSFTPDNFAEQVCDNMPSFLCKPDRLLVNVRTATSFTDAPPENYQYDSDGQLNEEHSYQQSGSGDIVIVNVIYKWPMFTSVMNLNQMDHGNERHLSSTMVFRNEPW
ncbi:MAG: TadE/TadG family type IV pilus assembly protein [Roseibium sp.]